MAGDDEGLAIEMTPGALARLNEMTRARERQRIAQMLDRAADRIADAGDADAAIRIAELAEQVRRMTTGMQDDAVAQTGAYGSKVTGDGTPVVAEITYADVELADELPQVHLNDDETDALNLVARDDQRRALEAVSHARAAG